MIVGLNTVSLIFLAGTLLVLLIRHFRKTTRTMKGRMILLPFLFLFLAVGTNLFEHSGLYPASDNWEDILFILFFPFLIFTIHSALLRRELKKSQESDRLKSAFLANLSHELRTPLNGIVGFCELLRDGTATQAETERYTELLGVSSERFLRLMDNLILLSRVESEGVPLRSEAFDAKSMIRNLLDGTRLAAERKDVALIYRDDPLAPPGTFRTDQRSLAVILGNLIDNALKFTDKGTVTVTAGKSGGMLRISVEDTGRGMSEEQTRRAFEHFGRLETGRGDQDSGIGLGLPIARRLTESMGGRLWADTLPGKGSRFNLEIPEAETD